VRRPSPKCSPTTAAIFRSTPRSTATLPPNMTGCSASGCRFQRIPSRCAEKGLPRRGTGRERAAGRIREVQGHVEEGGANTRRRTGQMSDTQFGKRDRAGHWKLYGEITEPRDIRNGGRARLIIVAPPATFPFLVKCLRRGLRIHPRLLSGIAIGAS